LEVVVVAVYQTKYVFELCMN